MSSSFATHDFPFWMLNLRFPMPDGQVFFKAHPRVETNLGFTFIYMLSLQAGSRFQNLKQTFCPCFGVGSVVCCDSQMLSVCPRCLLRCYCSWLMQDEHVKGLLPYSTLDLSHCCTTASIVGLLSWHNVQRGSTTHEESF